MNEDPLRSTIAPKFRVQGYKSTWNGEFYFRVRSRNGQIVMTSEGYIEKRSITRLFASLQNAGMFKDVVIEWEKGQEK